MYGVLFRSCSLQQICRRFSRATEIWNFSSLANIANKRAQSVFLRQLRVLQESKAYDLYVICIISFCRTWHHDVSRWKLESAGRLSLSFTWFFEQKRARASTSRSIGWKVPLVDGIIHDAALVWRLTSDVRRPASDVRRPVVLKVTP